MMYFKILVNHVPTHGTTENNSSFGLFHFKNQCIRAHQVDGPIHFPSFVSCSETKSLDLVDRRTSTPVSPKDSYSSVILCGMVNTIIFSHT